MKTLRVHQRKLVRLFAVLLLVLPVAVFAQDKSPHEACGERIEQARALYRVVIAEQIRRAKAAESVLFHFDGLREVDLLEDDEERFLVASYEATTSGISERTVNPSQSKELLLAQANQIEKPDVAKEGVAGESYAVEIDVEGVLVLVEPDSEEIRGRIMGILTDGSVILKYRETFATDMLHIEKAPENRLLRFPRGTVLALYRGNESEALMTRHRAILRAGYDPASVFGVDRVVFISGQGNWSMPDKYEKLNRRLPGYRGYIARIRGRGSAWGRDCVPIPIEQVISHWRDPERPSLDLPYTWTRAYAKYQRDNRARPFTAVAFGAARFLNLPAQDQIPYPAFVQSEFEKKLDDIARAMAVVLRGIHTPEGKSAFAAMVDYFQELPPEEQASTIRGASLITKGIIWMHEQAKQEGFGGAAAVESERAKSDIPSGQTNDISSGKPAVYGYVRLTNGSRFGKMKVRFYGTGKHWSVYEDVITKPDGYYELQYLQRITGAAYLTTLAPARKTSWDRPRSGEVDVTIPD